MNSWIEQRVNWIKEKLAARKQAEGELSADNAAQDGEQLIEKVVQVSEQSESVEQVGSVQETPTQPEEGGTLHLEDQLEAAVAEAKLEVVIEAEGESAEDAETAEIIKKAAEVQRSEEASALKSVDEEEISETDDPENETAPESELLAGNAAVLAEQAAEINAQIEEILGSAVSEQHEQSEQTDSQVVGAENVLTEEVAAETEPTAVRAETESAAELTETVTAEAENTKAENTETQEEAELQPTKKKFGFIYLAGAVICVAVLALIVWAVGGVKPPVVSDTTEPSTEEETRLEMAVLSAEYNPVLRLTGDEITHPDYQTMLDNMVGWIGEYGRINVRQEPSIDSYAIDYVVYGDKLTVYEEEGEFTRIKFVSSFTGEIKEGYCYTAYITNVQPEGAAVYLNVPLYKQGDARWASKMIGGYETLGSAGCTTTCISMVESYVNGRTIYPDEMSDMLPYTYDGLLTFPSRYSKYFARDYMQKIVELLHQGIPCLVSGYTSTGRTHWVVVVGYNGDGETFSPENFQINDPGANRNTLADFFRDYPLFEKIVYYAK